MPTANANLASYRAARDFLLAHRTDLDAAHAGFRWPQLTHSTGRWTISTTWRRTTMPPRCGSWPTTAASRR